MFNVLNSKKESEAPVLSNIRVIKIIAIILGCLIIVGLVALFLGLANSYRSIEKLDNNKHLIVNDLNNKLDLEKLYNTILINN